MDNKTLLSNFIKFLKNHPNGDVFYAFDNTEEAIEEFLDELKHKDEIKETKVQSITRTNLFTNFDIITPSNL